MKVVAYSIQPSEKESLIKANQKKHDITLISNPITLETVGFAQGKNVVIISDKDELSVELIAKLAAMGIRFITIRSAGAGHIDRNAAAVHGIKLANVPPENAKDIAGQTIRNIDLWQQEKCVGSACICSRDCRAAKNEEVTNQHLNHLP